MKRIKVKIMGQVYSLVGESEKIMKTAAREVEEHLQDVMDKYKNESTQMIYTIAALNIAEKLAMLDFQNRTDEEFVVNEIKKIARYLIENI